MTLDAGTFAEWQVQTLSFLTNLLGSDHVYVQGFMSAVRKASSSDVKKGQGMLKAVREDIEGGYLRNVRALVLAEVFTDFLELAEHLHEAGYKDPVASLAGAVLEDGLPMIAVTNGAKLKTREDLGSLNRKVADKGVYNRLVQKRSRYGLMCGTTQITASLGNTLPKTWRI